MSEALAIPRGSGLHRDDPLTESVEAHLRWLNEKRRLAQDVCLIAAPGGFARWLVYRFAHERQQRVEHVLLTRDSSDADLKQRRELVNGSMRLCDGPVVRAAVSGAVLLLEGVERAERNVLPVLNNLLENRACPLEHGAALISSQRYAELLVTHSAVSLAELGLRPCHRDFQIVAILAPSPPFPGAPLDPPLRSRFAARVVGPLPLDAQLAVTRRLFPAVVAAPAWRAVLALERFCFAQQDAASGGALLRVPPFSSTAVAFAARSLAALPHQSPRHLVSRLWPLEQLACDDASHIWHALEPELGADARFGYRAVGVLRRDAGSVRIEMVSERDGARVSLDVPGGSRGVPSLAPPPGVVAVDELHVCLSAMLADAAVGRHLCVMAAEGCGKSVACAWLAQALGYAADEVVFVDLFKEVSCRDLFLRRDTDASGDTVWTTQPLVAAVLAGQLAVLDGAHRPPPGVLAALTELLLDNQLTLDDGSKILCAAAYDGTRRELALSDAQMLARGWRRAHESFRLLLCGNTASSHAEERVAAQSWLTADLVAGLRCHCLPELTPALLQAVLRGACGAALPDVVLGDLCAVVELQRRLVRPTPAAHANQEAPSGAARKLEPPRFTAASLPLLSLRAALRAARHASRYGVLDAAYDGTPAAARLQLLERALRLAYAPPHAAETIREALVAHIAATPLPETRHAAALAPLKLAVENGFLVLGDVRVPVEQGAVNEARIPRTLFFEVPSQLALLRLMIKDFVLGEHLLLISTQGTGKNRLVDEFVRLLHRECNYVQLHRDTTLQSLTTAATLDGGRLRMVDSPVLEALVNGRILIVDEADKAPREVVAALRALAADGALTLSDGRRVRCGGAFRIFFLANRVGFPFLGENVLAELGDVCAVHSVDNLDVESEVAMLRAYAPHVPADVLRLLCELFADLRQLVARGELAYPYSLREIVAVARHLELFGAEQGLGPALRNVFDFDAHNAALRRTLAEAAARHGIALFSADDDRARAAAPVRLVERRVIDADVSAHRVTTGAWRELAAERVDVAVRGVWTPDHDSLPPPPPVSLREAQFDERLWQWRPRDGDGGGRLVAACWDQAGQLHVMSARPLRLYSVPTAQHRGRSLSLQQHVPWFTGDWAASGSGESTASFAVLALSGSRIAMLIGWFGLLLVVDGAGNVEVFNAPPAGPVDAPSIGIAGPLSFIAIARANSSQFANVQDAALVASKAPLQLAARPVTAIVAPRHALLWRVGQSVLALVCFAAAAPLPVSQLDVGRVVRSVHWLGDGDPHAPLDVALLACDGGATLLLRVPLAAGTPPFAVLDVGGLDSSQLRAAARCAADGFVALAFDEQFVAKLTPSWPDERMAAGLAVWQRGSGAARAVSVQFLHRSHQVASVVLDDDVAGLQLELVDVARSRARVVALPPLKKPSKSSVARLAPVVAEAVGGGEVAVIGETTDNTVIVIQSDAEAMQRSLDTWRFIRGSPASQQAQQAGDARGADGEGRGSGSGDGTSDSQDAQGQGAGDGRGQGRGDGTGTGAPDEGENEQAQGAAELSEEARLFAQRALREKLAAIDLSEYDARAYEARLARVGTAVTQLRSIFEAAQAASRERQWQSRKTTGELDENRLVDGLTGERGVYRVRAERDPGLFQPLPKVLIFCVDASASMERFNAHDRRLDRTLDCLVMIMEALDGFESKFAYEIVGHSGDQPAIDVGVPLGRPPRSRGERWRVVRRVATHAANCASGDASVEALRRAVRRAASVEADERIVLLLSDANLARHGIGASDLAEAMAVPLAAAPATPSMSQAGRETLAIARAAQVRCRCLFVAQWKDAARVQAALPRGSVHLVERVDELPLAIAASLAGEATTSAKL